MFAKMITKNVLPMLLCGALLSACAGTKGGSDAPSLGVNGQGGKQDIEITGGIIDANPKNPPIVSNDPSVQVFPIDGPVQNPLSVERYNSVLDNTTAGGYTVFDDSVKVYALPGQEVPAFVPAYAVPPLKDQYKPEAPMVGQPTSLAGSTLPPVPTIDVGEADPFANPPIPGAVRQPLTLTSPEPVTMQAPSSARAPMLSPFGDEPSDIEADDAVGIISDDTMEPMGNRVVRGPMLTGDAPGPMDGGDLLTDEQAATNNANAGAMTAGRRSVPSLTGY